MLPINLVFTANAARHSTFSLFLNLSPHPPSSSFFFFNSQHSPNLNDCISDTTPLSIYVPLPACVTSLPPICIPYSCPSKMPCTLLSILPIDGFSADDLPSNLRCTLLCIDYNREDDIQDHTELNVDNVQRRFTAYKAEVKKAAERKGQPLPPSVEKNTRILQFHNYKLEDDPSAYYDYYDLDSDSEYERKEAPGDCLPRAYSPSVTPVDQLTKTMIQGLQLETHHRGQYVLLKTITEMHNLYWAMVVVEDEDGDTLLLQLHNQGPYLESDLGTVFLVKEPYVTKVADGTFGIRVDHPADVKPIPQFHGFTREFMFGGIKEEEGKEVLPVDPSRNFWKQKGNELYEERKYGLATYW